MKFLRLYSDDAECDKYGFLWSVPLKLNHEQVGVSSIHVELSSAAMMSSAAITMQCSLVKEDMWNTRGVFYNLDLTRGSGYLFSERPGGVGKLCNIHYANIIVCLEFFDVVSSSVARIRFDFVGVPDCRKDIKHFIITLVFK